MSMSHGLPRKREKPLRTYGKRSTSAPDALGQPPSKKLRLVNHEMVEKDEHPQWADREHHLNKEAGVSASKDQANLAPPTLDASRPLHASILSYFKPRTLAQRSPPREEAKRPKPSRNPSHRTPAPDAIHAKFKPRLLRLRAASLPLDNRKEASLDDTGGKQRKKTGQGAHMNQSTGHNQEGRGAGVRELEGHHLSRKQEDSSVNGETPNVATKVRRWRGVQTTLNISKGAAFAECKVCDTVWNPLYPDDVKYHAKRHAMILRARRRKQDDL